MSTKSRRAHTLRVFSEIHVEKKRRITLDEAVEESHKAVALVKSLGMKDISAGLEDATRASFRIAAGIHMHGILNDPDTYEYIKFEDFGREREFIINRLSGRGAISFMLTQKGINPQKAQVEKTYKKISSVTDEIISLDEDTLAAMYHEIDASLTQSESRA